MDPIDQETDPTGPPTGRAFDPPSSLVDGLSSEIQRRITTGVIPFGSWLRQETLASEFGVSRTPVREALRKLEAGGLVALVPQRGAFVRGPTTREIREAYQVRAELEGLASELAAARIGNDQLRRLRDAEELFRSSVRLANREQVGPEHETDDWFRANTLFHDVVQEAAGNERLRLSIADLHRSFPRNLTWSALRENLRLLEENIEQHQRIREAIADGNPDLARREMRAHIRSAGELVSDWFERQAPPSAAP
jgi:DNA-binding GntR family transcriptional regulator